MTKKEIKDKMRLNFIDDAEIYDICELISDIISSEADNTEKEEPYATNSIKSYREAARIVLDIADNIAEILAEEE